MEERREGASVFELSMINTCNKFSISHAVPDILEREIKG